MAERRDRRLLVPAATLVAGLGCAAVAAAAVGPRGVPSGLLAVLLVAGFFWSGPFPLQLAEGGGAALTLLVLLTNYVLRLAVVFGLLGLAVVAGAVDRTATGVSLIVCALVWVNARVALLGGVRST